MTKVAVGCDHGGFILKQVVMDTLKDLGAEVINYGCDSLESVNYPEYALKVANSVANKESDLGVLICGTGIGMSIAANKVKGIRCAVVTNTYMAQLTKNHNNANIIALGGRVINEQEAKDIVTAWYTAEYEGGRHQNRLNMISDVEDKNFK